MKNGKKITFKDKDLKSYIFYAGVSKDGKDLVTKGGRVLHVVHLENTLKKAIEGCYQDVEKVNFENMFYRKDIGQKGL